MRNLPGAAMCLLLGVTVMRAEDWPQFRGRDRNGVAHETGLLKTFPADGLKVRWRKPLGWGLSSPVIAQGRVFVTDAELKQPVAKERVLCFVETTGELLWTHAYETDYPDWAFIHGTGVGPCGTPVVKGDRVYATGSNGEVLCLDAKSGTLIWQRDFGKEYTVRTLECRTSPLLDGDLLIYRAYGKPGATLVALDKNTGNDVWKALDEGVASSSPIIVTAGGARQLIVWTGASVTVRAFATNPAPQLAPDPSAPVAPRSSDTGALKTPCARGGEVFFPHDAAHFTRPAVVHCCHNAVGTISAAFRRCAGGEWDQPLNRSCEPRGCPLCVTEPSVSCSPESNNSRPRSRFATGENATPAMKASVTDSAWTVRYLVKMMAGCQTESTN